MDDARTSRCSIVDNTDIGDDFPIFANYSQHIFEYCIPFRSLSSMRPKAHHGFPLISTGCIATYSYIFIRKNIS